MRKTSNIFKAIVACATLLLILPAGVFVTKAQKQAVVIGGRVIRPTLNLKADQPVVRTWAQIEEDDRTHVAPQEEPVPFRPMMDLQEYLDAKEAADRVPRVPRQQFRSPVRPLAPTIPAASIEGSSQTGPMDFPPDTHGAAGINDFVEVTNSRVAVYSKTTLRGGGFLRKGASLEAFMGYFTKDLVDPRVVYDSTFHRWIITAISRPEPEATTDQRFFIAVSSDLSPVNSFCVYNFNVIFSPEATFDFPQVGMDQNAIIITANVDLNNTASMFAIPKLFLYGCTSFLVPVYTDLVAPLAPPIVLDSNPNSFLIAAQPSGNVLKLYTLTGTGTNLGFGATLTGPVDVPVEQYAMPAPALQPAPCTGDTHKIGTGDSRFVNSSTQVGNSLWQIHTVAMNPMPTNGMAQNMGATPKFYEINTVTNSVVQSGFISASSTSQDFNASIAANASNDAFVTWSSIDQPAGVNAQVRFAGRRSTDPSGVIPSGTALFTSSACIAENTLPASKTQRWGDYSAVTIDPTNIFQAWVVNEKVNSSSNWGSRIGKVVFQQ